MHIFLPQHSSASIAASGTAWWSNSTVIFDLLILEGNKYFSYKTPLCKTNNILCQYLVPVSISNTFYSKSVRLEDHSSNLICTDWPKAQTSLLWAYYRGTAASDHSPWPLSSHWSNYRSTFSSCIPSELFCFPVVWGALFTYMKY